MLPDAIVNKGLLFSMVLSVSGVTVPTKKNGAASKKSEKGEVKPGSHISHVHY